MGHQVEEPGFRGVFESYVRDRPPTRVVERTCPGSRRRGKRTHRHAERCDHGLDRGAHGESRRGGSSRPRRPGPQAPRWPARHSAGHRCLGNQGCPHIHLDRYTGTGRQRSPDRQQPPCRNHPHPERTSGRAPPAVRADRRDPRRRHVRGGTARRVPMKGAANTAAMYGTHWGGPTGHATPVGRRTGSRGMSQENMITIETVATRRPPSKPPSGSRTYSCRAALAGCGVRPARTRSSSSCTRTSAGVRARVGASTLRRLTEQARFFGESRHPDG